MGNVRPIQSVDATWRVDLARSVARFTVASELLAILVLTAGMQKGNNLTALLAIVGVHLPAALYALRSATPQRTRAILLVLLYAMVALAGWSTVGPLAGPSVAMTVSVVLAGVLLGRVALAWTSVAVLLMAALVASAMVMGWLPGPTPEDVSPHLARTWLRTFSIGLMTLLALGVAITWVVEQMEATVARVTQEGARRQEAEHRAAESQKLELVGRLAASVAHDVNNQLTVVRMWNSELADGALDRREMQHATQAINHAVEQASVLARQLLVLGRQNVRAPRNISLRSLVDAYLVTLRRMVTPEVSVTVEHVPSPPAWAHADEAQLHQVVLNLVLNARDAIPGSGTIVVRTRHVVTTQPAPAHPRPLPPGAYAVLEVEDNGTGMDAATASRVFEPFFTTKSAGQGTGLGLPAVVAIADQSNAHLTMDTRLGSGTRVALWLPAVESQVEPGAQATATRPVFHGRTVLLVEDQAASREVTEKVLRDAGFTVLSAPTADEAVALLAGHQGTIDVLCSDVVMPGRPVKDLLEAFGAAHPNGATLLCSGFVGEELVRRGIAEGRYPVLHKPFAPEALLLALQQALQSRTKPG